MKAIEEALDLLGKHAELCSDEDKNISGYIAKIVADARAELAELKKGNRIAYPPDFMCDKEKDAVMNKKINDLDMLLKLALDKYIDVKRNLKGIEWVQAADKSCPACGFVKAWKQGHDKDCWLAKMIGGGLSGG